MDKQDIENIVIKKSEEVLVGKVRKKEVFLDSDFQIEHKFDADYFYELINEIGKEIKFDDEQLSNINFNEEYPDCWYLIWLSFILFFVALLTLQYFNFDKSFSVIVSVTLTAPMYTYYVYKSYKLHQNFHPTITPRELIEIISRNLKDNN